MSSCVKMSSSLVVVRCCSVLKPHTQNAAMCVSPSKGCTLAISMHHFNFFVQTIFLPCLSFLEQSDASEIKLIKVALQWCSHWFFTQKDKLKVKCFVLMLANFNLHRSSVEFFPCWKCCCQKKPHYKIKSQQPCRP